MKVATLVLVAALAMTSACANLKNVISNIPTEKYAANLCATGAVVIPCVELGTVNIPAGGDTIAALVLAVAAPQLQKSANLKSCLVTTYPAVIAGEITVTATAACKLNGIPVNEELTLKLSPVATE